MFSYYSETLRCHLCSEDLTRYTADARTMHNAAHKEEQAKGELICEFSL